MTEPGETTAPGARRIEVGRVISETFSMYGSYAAPLLATAAVIFLISGVIQGLLNEGGGLILALIGTAVGLTAQALYTGFVVKLVQDVRDGRRDHSVGELVSSTQHAILPLIGNGILKGIAVAIGFLLLIVPGLILLTIWAVTSPSIVVGREGVVSAFGRSYELVKGQAWQVFGVILIAFLIAIGVTAIAVAIGAAIGVGGVIVLATVAGILTAPIPALVASILFFDLGGDTAPPESMTATAPQAPAA